MSPMHYLVYHSISHGYKATGVSLYYCGSLPFVGAVNTDLLQHLCMTSLSHHMRDRRYLPHVFVVQVCGEPSSEPQLQLVQAILQEMIALMFDCSILP